MIVRLLVVGQLNTNCYLVACERTRQAMVIDPGGDAERILKEIDELQLIVDLIVLTHFHFDHVLAAEAVRSATEAPLAIHHSEADLLADPPALFRFFAPTIPSGIVADQLLNDGDRLAIGDLEAEVLPTPGHSPGGISHWFQEKGVVFTGDALFREGIGRTDLPRSDHKTLIRSVREQLYGLPDDTAVYPGHGPKTTIGHERRHKPWLRV